MVQLTALSFRKKNELDLSFITKISSPSAKQIARNGTNICIYMLAATKPPHHPTVM